MDEDSQIEMINRATFGKQVEEFLNTDIGRYMVARANEEKRRALLQIVTVDCTNAALVQNLQNAIIRADSIVSWLKDAVRDGIQALNLLDERS